MLCCEFQTLWVKSVCFGTSPGFAALAQCGENCVRLIYVLNSELTCCDVILCIVRGVCIWGKSLHGRVFLCIIVPVCILLGQLFATWSNCELWDHPLYCRMNCVL